MTRYDQAVWRDAAEAVSEDMAKAARLALKRECAGASDEITKHVFGAAVVAMIAQLDEAKLQRAIGSALTEKRT
jgi:hypothetical protein